MPDSAPLPLPFPEPPPTPAEFYSPEEVAQFLRVSRRTVYFWLTTGRMLGWKAGAQWRITREALDAFLAVAGRLEGPQHG